MSGGSYEYAYEHVQRFAEHLERGIRYYGEPTEAGPHDVLRRAFAAHLHLVAEAMKAIEWVDSYDSSPPVDEDAIRKVLQI